MLVVIVPFIPVYRDAVVALSLRAWAPVFEEMRPAVQPYVYDAFYPDGWEARQAKDIGGFLDAEGHHAWVALAGDAVRGWVGIRLHPEDGMGEIYILATDPEAQRQRVATALMDHAMAAMRQAGMTIVMVETGGDPGHAASRATYERAGFERWPVARYFRQL